MELGLVGLGKMGANMTARLTKRGHRIVATDRNPDAVRSAVDGGAAGAASIRELVDKLGWVDRLAARDERSRDLT